jgi:purine/pyrimidine-nucleoside phosphorylase
MEILSGEVAVRLEDDAQWNIYGAGEHFEVAGDSAFDIQVKSVTDYCCSYVD